ncbi:MAG TPA: MIP/aquaporin family protein [Bauldia sp.]|nr:MIP/aquaporin family protein [Bauldia sp.]
MADLPRRLAAEAIGSAFLVGTVIGSGVMAARLADGNVALMLLANTLATGAILTVLIAMFGPVSGAHFNPVVTLVLLLRGEVRSPDAAAYGVAEVCGAIAGVVVAHAMFGLPLLQVGAPVRDGWGQWLGEAVATFGLVLTIFGCRDRPILPAAVGLYIAAAYWFTASTSFANPAVTIARAFSDTFAGIAPASVPAFIVAQVIGGVGAMVVARWVFAERARG